MNALTLNKMMDLSVEYYRNGSKIKRNVKAGQMMGGGRTMLFVETEVENGKLSSQWIEMRMFESWLGQINNVAA